MEIKLLRKNTNVALQCLLFTVIIFCINSIIPSYINGFPKSGLNFNFYNLIDNDTAENVFHSRYNSPIFRSRPLMLESQKFLMEHLNIPYQLSFNIVNFVLMFVLFVLVSKVNLTESKNVDDGSIIRFAFLLSMPILFSFFGTICTHDDIFQYVFILLFLHYLFNDKYLISALFLSVACIARETSFIYYFIILSYFYLEKRNKNLLAFFVLPIISYYLFLDFYFPKAMVIEAKHFVSDVRFTAWRRNFRNWLVVRETLTLLSIMTIPYIIILIWKYLMSQNRKHQKWVLVLIIFIILNAIIVILTGLVREIRLLFLPIVLVIPLIHKELRMLKVAVVNSCIPLVLNKKYSFLIYLVVSGIIAFVFYTPSAIGTGYVFKTYIFLYITVFIFTIKSITTVNNA